MNIIKRDKQIIRYESYWRNKKTDDTRDSDGKLFPFPKDNPKFNWTEKQQFMKRLRYVQNLLINNSKFYNTLPKDCLLCDAKNISKGEFKLNNIIWEDGLIHYIDVHNVKPSDDFIDLIYNFNYNKNKVKLLRINGEMYQENDFKYIKLDRNQIMIMDALMKHGGYTKKYIDLKNKKIYRYSEHAGLIDFNDKGIDKIIISGRTNRVDEGDEEIYLPKNIPEAYDYEYIFHTHPPTPKVGGRAESGILYEFPSVSDVFHFMDHYNDGRTQGSLVVTPEGLYNIRPLILNKSKIIIDEDEMYKQATKKMNKLQNEAIKKYGTDFNTNTFYSKIAQDLSYINELNKIYNKYQIHIDFYPRIRDENNRWIIDTVHLPIYVIEKVTA